MSTLFLVMATTSGVPGTPAEAGALDSGGPAPVSSYGQLPIGFEANLGQTSGEVRFLSRGNGYTLFLTPVEAVLMLQKPAEPAAGIPTTPDGPADESAPPAVLRMRFVGADRAPALEGLEATTGRTNYFIGNNPDRWLSNVPTYRRVRYASVYPGIDAIYHGSQGELEYDMVVAPGADPGRIVVRFDGADRMSLDADGRLILTTAGGDVRLRAPVAYQDSGNGRALVSCSYMLGRDGGVRFRLGAYDSRLPLTIDPILEYSSYIGGSSFERSMGIAADAAGQAHLTGWTRSADFPTANARQPVLGEVHDVFVVKLNSDGTDFVFSTYLGGSTGIFFGSEGNESGLRGDIALDPEGNIYVTGQTESTDFPVTPGALKSTLSGFSDNSDAFLTKLDPSGSVLLYSTYLGGTSGEDGFDVAADASGNAYVAGLTHSDDFPTLNAVQTEHFEFTTDTFVTKINTLGGGLVYSTYIGGSLWDWGVGIAIDASGSAYVSGQTGSPDFPTTPGAFQPMTAGGADAFVLKLDPSGSSLAYSTYLGGGSEDFATAVAVDGSGRAYVTGATYSADFPIVNAYDPSGPAGFVASLDPSGASLVFSTFLGGDSFFCGGEDVGTGIAVDASGKIHVTGFTSSCDFPTMNSLQCGGIAGQSDAFVTVFNSSASDLVFSTYLGGNGLEHEVFFNSVFVGGDIALDPAGRIYVTGYTQSDNFPVRNALQPNPGGDRDGFVARINLEGDEAPTCDVVVTQTDLSDPVFLGGNLYYSLTVSNLGPSCAENVVVRDLYPSTATFYFANSSTGSCYDSSGTVVCSLGNMAPGDVATIDINLGPTTLGTIENLASVTTTTPDVQPENNISLEQTLVDAYPDADVQVTQSHTPLYASIGRELRFIYTVVNHGPDEAVGVNLYHEFSGVPWTMVSISSSRGSCDTFGSYSYCGFGDLGVGESAFVEISVVPNDEGTLTSYANGYSQTGDIYYENNSSYEDLVVFPTPEQLLTDLAAIIQGYGLNRGHEKNLLTRLQAAVDGLADEDSPEACSELDAFRRKVATFAGRSLTVAQAGELDLRADQLQSILECTSLAGLTSAAPAPGLKETGAFSFRLVSPPGDRTRTLLTLPAAGPVRVDVYDVRGRRMETVMEGDLSAGAHEIGWDGLGSDGSRVPAGMYFLRVVAGVETGVVRTVILK